MGHEPRQQPEADFDPDDLPREQPEPDDSSRSVPRLTASTASGDLIGKTLNGRYRFDALLGEGTFARVFRVYDVNRRVNLAAKVLRSDIAQEPMFLERFRREARVLERLQHPHIVRYYDIVESDEVVFILTDYIAGHTLQSVLRREDGAMAPHDALNILTPLAAALHYAHNEGVVHRDLKPANILIDDNGGVYVTDFGIARLLTDASTLTMDTTATLGTPHYMSPEQIMVGEVGPATDVYALGVMLYQMLTGHLPFTGDLARSSGTTTAMRIAYEHLHMPPPSPRQLNPALSQAVEDVILTCLRKDPAQRYPNVSAVYDALSAAVGVPAESHDAGHEPEPVAERVPTGVGGASRIGHTESALPVGAVADDEGDEAEEYDHFAWGDDWRVYQKRKRELKREARKAKRRARYTDEDYAEMSEKEREKKRESEEKSDEKSREKGTEIDVEKGEFFSDLAPSDHLSQLTWGGMVLWAGIVFFLSGNSATASMFSDVWAWIFGGAGALLLAEVGARLLIPEFRSKPGARLVLGVTFLMIGLGMSFSFAALWPVILIAIGASLLINQLVD